MDAERKQALRELAELIEETVGTTFSPPASDWPESLRSYWEQIQSTLAERQAEQTERYHVSPFAVEYRIFDGTATTYLDSLADALEFAEIYARLDATVWERGFEGQWHPLAGGTTAS